MSWQEQEDAIRELGKKHGCEYRRPEERVVVEALLSISMKTDKRLLEGKFHWGPTLDATERKVLVNGPDEKGLYIGHAYPNLRGSKVGVVLEQSLI